MQKLLKFFAIFVSFSFLINLIPQRVFADVGEVPSINGIITAGDKTDSIEMKDEKVIFDIRYGDENSPFYQDYMEDDMKVYALYAHVSADFTMRNISSDEELLQLMFPVQCNFPDLDYFEPDSKNNQALNFIVKVDGKDVEYDYAVYDIESFKNADDWDYESTLVIEFPVSFKTNVDTSISVEYDARLVNEPKSMYGTFNYIMETGSHWSGNIGSGQVIFQFPGDISESMFSSYNDFFEMEEDMLVWNFTNLEPDENYNIKVSYAPKLMNAWEDKETYIEDISSFGDSEFMFDEENTPEGYFFGFTYRLEGNVSYLVQDMEEGATNGWFAESSGGKNPWFMLDLDAIYKIDSMDILPSIAMEAYSDAGDSEMFYDVFERPKQVKLSYSDGTSEVVDLTDSKGEIQTLDIDPVETSSVKIEILDTYPTYNGESEVLGIARVAFGVGEKVGEKQVGEETDGGVNLMPQVSDDRSGLEKFWDKNQLGIIMFGGGFLLLVSGVTASVVSKKKGKTAKNIEVKEEGTKEKVEKPEKKQNLGNEEVSSGREDEVK
jgi:hypothetical protein